MIGREAVEATEQLEMRNSGGMAVAAMEMAKPSSGSTPREEALELRALPSQPEGPDDKTVQL